ncbi:TraR/DksA family transcriptional regulator [Sphaerisporangium corydalis]|uniref:TraR/DksA family transcriptional regulator n=1 Tax=Sphaerisporangium corydalis TaxID=1441875 RepID=A0ABV9EUH9_9ACTN|nr:TraR/DksA C4-type zinc finger protein [Sphaerisporangium corydalis]
MPDRPPTALSTAEETTMRDLLGADRELTMARITALTRDWDDMVESSSLVATDDEHDPEGSSTAFERAHVQSLLDQARTHLTDLDRALDRLHAGTYGVCEGCGHPIPLDRLKARPATTTCITCATH